MGEILIYLIEGIFIGLVIDLIVFFMMTKKSINLEKRLTRFAISPLNDKSVSIFDRLEDRYEQFITKLSNALSHLKLSKKISKRYEKYYLGSNDIKTKAMNIVSIKLLLFLIVSFVVVLDLLRRNDVTLIYIFVSIMIIIISFFLPDIVLRIRNYRKSKTLENDLLKAVLIMSNAFKSGRSVMQTVKIVSEELDGPVAEEFKKIYVDLSYGLDIEVAFERLSSRMKLEETKYMASSLAILNKTGGNVVKIFSSIENSFFERKKLNDELKSVTALSKFVFWFLIFIPIIIIIFMSISNKEYFLPFINNAIGNVILILIIIIYILYIILVRRIIKIKD